jgi:hypothetical protein
MDNERIHEAENAMPTPSLTVLLVQSLTLASLMSPASTVEYDRLPERREHPWTPGPDQWSSVPLVRFERRDDPSWPQADDDSSGSRVALAELVRAIGSYIPGGDAGCSVQQLLVILGYGGPPLTFSRSPFGDPRRDRPKLAGWCRSRRPSTGGLRRGSPEIGTTCCFATQDKVWVTGPAGEKWEVYTVLSDSDTFGSSSQHLDEDNAEGSVCCGGAKRANDDTQSASAGACC